MDAPSWWNNKFWRPANTAFTGDTYLQKPSTPTNSGPPLTATFGGQNRRIIRPTLRSDLYRRDSARPLGSLRVTHGRRPSLDASRILQRPSSASRTVMPGPGRTSLPNSLSTDEVRNSTVPMNAFNYILKNSSGSKSSTGGGEVHVNVNFDDVAATIGRESDEKKDEPDEPTIPTFQQYQQQQLTQQQKQKLQQQHRMQRFQINNPDNQGNYKVPDGSPQNGDLEKQFSNNQSYVVSSQYGRKIVRPYSSGIITRVGEIKLVDLEETLNIQPQHITSKHSSPSDSLQSVTRPAISTSKEGNFKLPSSYHANYKPVFYNSNLMGNFGGNTTVAPTEVISKPPKIPLKSILKKNEPLPSQSSESGPSCADIDEQDDNNNPIESIEKKGDNKADNGNDGSVKQLSKASTDDNNSRSSSTVPDRPILKSSKTLMFNDAETQKKRILVRRNMRSAPTLKRGVRFDMRSTDVVEFYTTDSICDIRLIK